MDDYEYTDELKCPYCGYVENAYYEIFEQDEEINDIECPRCEQEFTASLHISHDFRIWRKE